MYIAPNSTIKLLTGVPIDKNQSDTLWFASVGAQTAYFNSKVKRTFSAQTYQRIQRGYARIEVSADAIYDCNYMMFQNTSYGNKWFYAFINSVEYINNDVAEVRFTIDPVQTWFFDYTLHQCFIERETPSTDEIGDNILPEPVGIGEHVLNGTYEIIGSYRAGVQNPVNQGDFGINMGIVVQYINPQTAGGGGAGYSEGSMICGVYSAAELFVYGTSSTEIQALQSFINAQAQAIDTITNIYMMPLIAIGLDSEADILTTYPDRKILMPTATTLKCLMTAITKNTALDGYTPRNAKCYTYPYTFYHVDAPNTQSLICRYEFFVQHRPRFIIKLNATYPVEITLFPASYKNGPDNTAPVGEEEYRPEKLSIQGFPQCSWSMDAYTAWLAQNSVPLAVGAVSKVGMGIANGTGTGGLVGALTGGLGAGVSAITDVISQDYTASIAADISKGSFNNGSNDVASERLKFKGGCMTQPYNYIKAIDQFFDAFGYAKRAWGTVNNHKRSRWTYIKTIGANVDGELPADDAKYIADCYDRGIRFWADTTHPCDYSTANGFLS